MLKRKIYEQRHEILLFLTVLGSYSSYMSVLRSHHFPIALNDVWTSIFPGGYHISDCVLLVSAKEYIVPDLVFSVR
jgi:hypothetical protein